MEDQTTPTMKSETGGKKLWAAAFAVTAVMFAVFQIYTAGFGPYIALVQRSIHVCFGIVVCTFFFRMQKEKIKKQPLGYYLLDIVEIIATLGITIYAIMNLERLIFRLGFAYPTQTDVLLGYIMILILIDACRKAIGWIFTGTMIVFIAYALFGPYLPGILNHAGYSPSHLAAMLFVNPLGIYGTITGASANIIAIYFLFGAVLLATGGAKAFLNLAIMMAARLTGGAAQVAAVSSGMLGMINGSAVANVATTGAFTIPMMKSRGYPSHFAGGVEAAASVGGQITPPIMGAGVFIMAELIEIPYIDIAKMAAIPAILYYFAIMVTIYFEAKKRRIAGLKKDEIPKFRTFWIEFITLTIPVSVLVYFIVMRYTPRYAGFWGLVLSIAMFFIFKIFTPKNFSQNTFVSTMKAAGSQLWNSLMTGASTVANIAVLVAGAQVMVCIMGITGVGLKLAQLALGFGAASIFPYLFLGMVICLILGMGLPTVPSYIITVVIVSPILEGLGLPKVVIHLFVFYYAIMSGITPPVAAAAYVGSVLAHASWLKTCREAIRIGIAGYMVPFVFAYHPALLGLEGHWLTGQAMLISAVGLLCIAISLGGYCNFAGDLNIIQRGLMLTAGVLVLNPHTTFMLMGIGTAFLALVVFQKIFQIAYRIKASP